MQVRYILASDIYNKHIVVFGGYDQTTATIQVTSYHIQTNSSNDVSNIILIGSKTYQVNPLSGQNIYKFKMVLVPKSTIAIMSTD
jgi:hypothetical protein